MIGPVLPPLRYQESPNASSRTISGAPYLIVVHRPVGSYVSATATFLNPAAQVSAHVLTDGPNRATQFVPWHRKAWACESFNSASYNIEVDDDAWNGRDTPALAVAARIVAYLCLRTGIPAVWTHDPLHIPGVCRHYDLGRAGGGHTDPTTDAARWRAFMLAVKGELDRGGFRESWGTGTLHRIDV